MERVLHMGLRRHGATKALVTLACVLLATFALSLSALAHGGEEHLDSPDLRLVRADVTYKADLDLLVFEQQVEGTAGGVIPHATGALDGAAVIGYVFPLDLDPSAVGFEAGSGILALAVTVHPDFDDTPLWDENNDGNYDNDGGLYHAHWVVLESDHRVPGGLAVKAFMNDPGLRVAPRTHPGLDLYIDSPGFSVLLGGDILKVIVPSQRIADMIRFNFDAVTVYLEVNAADENRPMLGVYTVYDVLSGDLSLPYEVTVQE